jgi:hypothetical protein
MKKIAIGLLAVLALAVGALLIAAAMQPDTFRVERSREMATSPERIRPHLTDLRQWAEWNPWRELDPNQRTTFSDPASGVGAHYTWEGNDEVGKGRMDITSITDDAVRYRLSFIEPFESSSDVEIVFEPRGERTRVVWTMSGESNFVSKIFGVFVDMDSMVGADFERGLVALERAASGE